MLIQYRETMYKKRFQKWNARKYNEENEMKAIVRKTVERTGVGKASAFQIRGRVVDFEEAIRYWERKNRAIADVLTRREMSRTPEAVKCFTPLQSPLRAPEVLAIPERILVTLQDYILGSFDIGKWTDSENGRSVQRFCDLCCLALDLFHYNRCVEAGQALNRAFSDINTLLRSEEPSTFPMLFDITIRMFNRNRPELAFAILRQVSAMAEVLLGKSHPYKLVCMWLASPDQNETFYQDILTISLQKMGDCFEQLLGPMSDATFYYRLEFIGLVEIERDHKRAEEMFRKLLLECELSLGEHHYLIPLVRSRLASNLYKQENIIKAKEEFRFVLACLPPRDRSFLKGECLEWVAWSQYKLGDTQGAVATLRETIHSIQSGELSMNDGRTCRLMLNLEDWLSELGEFDSAAQVQEERMALQDSMNVEWL